MLEQTIFSRPAVLKESSIDVIGAPYSFGQVISIKIKINDNVN